MKKFGILWMVLMMVFSLSAQDFQCQLSINSTAISGSNRNKFNTLQQELYKFVNDRKWCQYTLKTNERIECAIMIVLTGAQGDTYTGDMTVQLQRPVFNTNYKSPVLNMKDNDIKFTYEEGTPLEYSENQNLSNLTSLIAYYLNIFLGLDFDTFSLNGGDPYFSLAQGVVNACQSATEQGWKSYENAQKNRYWLMENLSNPTYSKIHDFLYKYHRLGLDMMSESVDVGRASILDAIRDLQKVNSQKSNLYIVQVMVQAKADEIVNIFKEASTVEKTEVIRLMKQIDPANSAKYNAINQQ
ncbi:MAG: DUF4835 family protein [Bacteroidales bacterium]|nr:DUF4835 family protein [Bacteroidales bacterium]MBR4487929.1 DUF4835 family protein [Bacteroidales bacterium]